MNYLFELAEKIKSNLPAGTELPENSDSLLLLYALLAKVKGQLVSNEDVHDAWATWMSIHHQAHPSIVEFSKLNLATQAEDGPFVKAIKSSI